MDSTNNNTPNSNDEKVVPNETASKPSPNFGEWLKSHRTAKKVSLEEIAAVTKVHITQLRWLEENDTSKLPAPAFVRGFLVSYSRHLGIDENEVLEKYRQSFGSLNPLADNLMPTHQKSAQSSSAPKVRIVTSPSIKQAPGSKPSEENGPTLVNFRNLGIAAGALTLVALFVFLIWVGKNAKKNQPTADPKATQQVAESAPPTETPSVPQPQATASAPATTAPTNTPPAQPVTLKKFQGEVRAIEGNWLSLRIDDESSKGFNLKPGGVQTFEAQKRVTFNLSDAGNIEIKWNGVWYAAPGSRGDVVTLVLPDQLDTLTVKPAVRAVPKPVAKPTDAAPATTATPPAATNVTPAAPSDE
jgi:cytoskeletal protein RodZ